MEKFSRQRQEILDVLSQSYEHPTAEEIFQKVKQLDETVSRGTVYRNLGLLTKNGVVQQIAISNSPDRYDYKKETALAYCMQTMWKVKDFEDIKEEEHFEKLIKEKTGMQLTSSETIFHGICQECMTKKE